MLFANVFVCQGVVRVHLAVCLMNSMLTECYVLVFFCSYALVIFISFCFVCSTRVVLCLLWYPFSSSPVLVHYNIIMFHVGDMKKMRRPNGEVWRRGGGGVRGGWGWGGGGVVGR